MLLTSVLMSLSLPFPTTELSISCPYFLDPRVDVVVFKYLLNLKLMSFYLDVSSTPELIYPRPPIQCCIYFLNPRVDMLSPLVCPSLFSLFSFPVDQHYHIFLLFPIGPSVNLHPSQNNTLGFILYYNISLANQNEKKSSIHNIPYHVTCIQG